MEEEELRKIARDQAVIRVAAAGIMLVTRHALTKGQLDRLVKLDDEYLEKARLICPALTDV